MAKAEFEYACGHGVGEVRGINRAEANSKALWAAEHYLCDDCKAEQRKRQREQETAEAAKASENRKWPDLQGTDAQVHWALKLRHDTVAELEKLELKDLDVRPQILEWLLSQVSAKWWIETREYRGVDNDGQFDRAMEWIGFKANVANAYVQNFRDRIKLQALSDCKAQNAEAKRKLWAVITSETTAVFGSPVVKVKPWQGKRYYCDLKNGKQVCCHKVAERGYAAGEWDDTDRTADLKGTFEAIKSMFAKS